MTAASGRIHANGKRHVHSVVMVAAAEGEMWRPPPAPIGGMNVVPRVGGRLLTVCEERRYHRGMVCRPPSDRKFRMGAATKRVSHNAPDNMATSS
ncbi:MAG: hypothetical protein ACXWEI_10650, partial [Mycobacterium sp.]